ncbi:hypothetical protein BDM02DRAFT_3189263 [Thelephora ganbajun]|uniref:Uncharacterized protein n=1 Tax=Thelephora ganbajun TaxID=370292 RepID=A0ACB6Z8Y9_THEGA|nr:hypothetical protein BDM02DRAFT_3189263 [Thelephora ganbajun]
MARKNSFRQLEATEFSQTNLDWVEAGLQYAWPADSSKGMIAGFDLDVLPGRVRPSRGSVLKEERQPTSPRTPTTKERNKSRFGNAFYLCREFLRLTKLVIDTHFNAYPSQRCRRRFEFFDIYDKLIPCHDIEPVEKITEKLVPLVYKWCQGTNNSNDIWERSEGECVVLMETQRRRSKNTVLAHKDMAHTNAYGLIRGSQFPTLVFQLYGLVMDLLVLGLQRASEMAGPPQMSNNFLRHRNSSAEGVHHDGQLWKLNNCRVDATTTLGGVEGILEHTSFKGQPGRKLRNVQWYGLNQIPNRRFAPRWSPTITRANPYVGFQVQLDLTGKSVQNHSESRCGYSGMVLYSSRKRCHVLVKFDQGMEPVQIGTAFFDH